MGLAIKLTCTTFALLTLLPGAALAQAPQPLPEKRELIYCADRMTHEEREAYRARMRAARTIEGKDKIRAAHQAEMQARAASQGGAGLCEPPGRQWRGGRGQ
jgi:hypothetical protein